ncbi:hypothetical protein P171DRAFT_212192 [Karstenula rhodostoma CBS 690.94]|uniref:Uncharacterized protein n=1 Tax=Karstenula rhodostoma CBS 690.94 TaxID=1392251 RepID=A0A9P4PQ76_9PLEO|nr:hypothetical protein P171DRAFT_212192 [Karstenula rhodostoma CBS 690.94]
MPTAPPATSRSFWRLGSQPMHRHLDSPGAEESEAFRQCPAPRTLVLQPMNEENVFAAVKSSPITTPLMLCCGSRNLRATTCATIQNRPFSTRVDNHVVARKRWNAPLSLTAFLVLARPLRQPATVLDAGPSLLIAVAGCPLRLRRCNQPLASAYLFAYSTKTDRPAGPGCTLQK